MREIEIKARTANKPALLKALQENEVELSRPVTQRDQVFGLPGVNGGDDTNGAPWLRIRTETRDGKTAQIFTLKKSITNQMDSIEHETEIYDPVELTAIIQHLGFEPYSDLTKTRQKAKLGEIEICVDSVGELGDFIEAEKLTHDDASYDDIAVELWRVLEKFGISRADYITDGYDVLMRKHQGLEG